MVNQNKILLLLAAASSIVLLMKQIDSRRKRRKTRKVWSEKWLLKRQEGRGTLAIIKDELRLDDSESYRHFLRMCEENFDELLSYVKNDITKHDTNMRQCISTETRLSLTLRFVATGETYRSLMFSTRIHESTISLIIPEVCSAICANLKEEFLKMPTTVEDWKAVALGFESLWNFPYCIGAIDGKHINFCAPRSAGSFYYNYKGNHSIVLLAVADAFYKFLYVDIGVNGRVSDGGVYRESSLKKAIDQNILNFPPNKCLPGQNTPVSYTFVADDAFPLTTRIMKPFPKRGLTQEQRIFNYRLSRARRVVENSFGILANRFRILLNTIHLSPEKVELVTLTCCILHNYLIRKNQKYVQVTSDNLQLFNINQFQGGNRPANEALYARNAFTQYFVNEGSVAWQNNL